VNEAERDVLHSQHEAKKTYESVSINYTNPYYLESFAPLDRDVSESVALMLASQSGVTMRRGFNKGLQQISTTYEVFT